MTFLMLTVRYQEYLFLQIRLFSSRHLIRQFSLDCSRNNIMITHSHSPNSQSLSSQLQPQQDDSNQLLESPSSQNREGGSFEGENCINAEYKLQQSWKKQINNYFCCRKKYNRGKELKKWQIWTTILQNLLRCSVEQNDNKINSNPAQFLFKKSLMSQKGANMQQLSIFTKPGKSFLFHLIILSYRPEATKKHSLVFDLQILQLNGRMVFKKINFRNWKELKAQTSVVCQLYSIFMVAIFEKQKFQNLHVQNSEQFLKWVKNFEDLETIVKFEQKQVLDLVRPGKKNKKYEFGYGKTFVDLKKCIEKYLLLKREFQRRINHGEQDRCFTQDEVLTMAIAYNLLCSVIDPNKHEFEQQVRPYRETILKLFSEANNKLRRVTTLINNNKGHFPFNLDNAHLCWRCKTKRIYTYCPTCTGLEGHTLALCIDCYQPFHEERVKQIPKLGEESRYSLIEKWQAFDECVQKLIGVGRKNNLWSKKEENDSVIH